MILTQGEAAIPIKQREWQCIVKASFYPPSVAAQDKNYLIGLSGLDIFTFLLNILLERQEMARIVEYLGNRQGQYGF